MDFTRLLEIVGDEPVFESGLLLAGDVDERSVRRQLSRWVAAGRLAQLRRGLYAVLPPFLKVRPHPFLVANRMVRGSYVSLQAALAYYDLIPEHVPVVTSITSSRPDCWETALGVYKFHHLKPDLLYGYRLLDLSGGQRAFLATPEKALLDLVLLYPEADTPAFLREMRLQNLEQLDLDALARLADRSGRPKAHRAVDAIAALARSEAEEYEAL
jgi:predicted transcriptional regulator of viral defense system